MIEVLFVSANNPKRPVIVAHRQRNHHFNHRVAREPFGFIERNVAHRRVDLVDTGKNQLQRASLGPQHHVDAFDIFAKLIVQLLIEQQQQ